MAQAEKEKRQESAEGGEAAMPATAEGNVPSTTTSTAPEATSSSMETGVTQIPTAAAAAAGPKTAEEDFLWPDAGNDDTRGETLDFLEDPIFGQEEEAAAATENEEAPALALVHGVPAKSSRKSAKKKTKPKFRSKKKTAKRK